MEVNRDWYSGSTRQINDSSSNLVVQFLDHSLWTDIQADSTKYIAQEWDKSACPWKINYQSDFFNIDWMLGCNAGYEEPLTVYNSRLLQERKKGYTFYMSCNGHNNMSGVNAKSFPCWMATLSRSDIDITDSVTANWLNSKYKELHVVVNFDYDKIFTVPFVFTKNGVGTSFRESLRASWNSSDYAGFGVGFYYKHSGNTSRTAAISMVSLNNKFAAPDWDCTNSWEDDPTSQFDNGLCLVDHTVTSATQNVLQMIGERFQVAGSSGTYYLYGTTYANKDLAGIANYYPNKLNYINGSNDPDSIFSSQYYGGFISDNTRPFKRTLKAGVTFDEVKEYLMTQLAYLGFRFCPDGDKVDTDIHGEYFYIPEIDEKGVTTGVYYAANSASAAMLPNNIWNTNVFEQTPYDGSDDEEDDDPNTYDDNTTQLNTNWVNQTYSYFGLYYILDGAAMQSLHATLFSTYAAQITDSLKQCLTLNPIDVVKSLRMFPFDIASHLVTTATETIKLGGYDTGISSEQFTQYLTIIDAGYCTYHPEFNTPDDFREYEPYSSATLILPYCGSIDISPTLYLDKKITVKYVVDLQTGECLALIFRQDRGKEGDGMVVDSIGGHMAVDIPISGVNGAQIEAAQMQAATAYKNARNKQIGQIAAASMSGVMTLAAASNPATFAASAVTTGQMALNAASASNNVEEAKYQLDHINVPFVTRGQSSSATSYANEQRVRLIIKRPIMSANYNEAEYGHNVGFATYDTATLDSYTGFTVCAAADTSGITATLRERALIKEMLLSGVYL